MVDPDLVWHPRSQNLSAGHVLDKHSDKMGLGALRLIHLFCTWWRNVFGALLEEDFADTKLDRPEWMHGFLKRRKRDHYQLMQRATGEHLRAAGVTHISDLDDMSNAFARTVSEERFRTNDEL